jgi:hypothetical protein
MDCMGGGGLGIHAVRAKARKNGSGPKCFFRGSMSLFLLAEMNTKAIKGHIYRIFYRRNSKYTSIKAPELKKTALKYFVVSGHFSLFSSLSTGFLLHPLAV